MRTRIGEPWNRFTTFRSCLTTTLEQQLVQSIISSLWNFQNSKCELTTDHKAVENIVLFSHFFSFPIVFSSSLIHSISIEFPKQKIKTYHSKSVLNPNHRIHTCPKHKCRSIFSLPFLLIKLVPFFQFLKLLQKCPSSFVVSTQVKFLIVFAWRAQKNFWMSGKFVRPAMVFPKCDYKSRYELTCEKYSLCRQPFSFLLFMRELNSSRIQATKIRNVFRQFCAGIKLANNSPARALLLFLLFSLWF